MHKVHHFYPEYLPSFSVKTLNVRELMAEKMSASIGRNRPRDHFDLYKILQKNFLLDLDLVRKKCELSGYEFDITKMFNKAQKLKKQWDEEMEQFLQEKISFQEVMTTLAKHFHLKEEKKKKQALL